MGIVYICHDNPLHRELAVKVLREELRGNAAAEHYIDTMGYLDPEKDCVGRGDDPETAIEVASRLDPADEVRAGIACVRLRAPGRSWFASKLMTDGKRTIAFVMVRRPDRSDGFARYIDVSRFATKVAGDGS